MNVQPAGWYTPLTSLALAWVPPLLLVLGALYVFYPWLNRLPYWQGALTAWLLANSVTALVLLANQRWLMPDEHYAWGFAWLITTVDVALCLYYLDLLQRAYSPAIAEARLQALQARIRPHFLFNSLNAVLSLIRSHPKQAETALEDMASLFRVLMADNSALVPLSQEVALCQQYLNIEKLRLGERLVCVWQHATQLPAVRIPPLILQPLLENAVYHGIEPRAQGGTIDIALTVERQHLLIRLRNPIPDAHTSTHGNQMAIKNIRERLRLHYDFEAQLRLGVVTQGTEPFYQVELRLPIDPHASFDTHASIETNV